MGRRPAWSALATIAIDHGRYDAFHALQSGQAWSLAQRTARAPVASRRRTQGLVEALAEAPVDAFVARRAG